MIKCRLSTIRLVIFPSGQANSTTIIKNLTIYQEREKKIFCASLVWVMYFGRNRGGSECFHEDREHIECNMLLKLLFRSQNLN